MRCSFRFIVLLAVLCGSASAHSNSPLDNVSPRTELTSTTSPFKNATLRSKLDLFLICTPFDPHSTDPQRKIYMQDVDQGYRTSCSLRAKHVLSYLRQMERVSKKYKRQDMVWVYQEAWEFAAAKIYGALPPRTDIPEVLAHNPDKLPLPPAPPGPRPRMQQQPLRKIVKLVTRPYRTWELTYEQLECGHELLAPVGYRVPAERRRCVDCAREALARKKKPAASASMAPRSKAVRA